MKPVLPANFTRLSRRAQSRIVLEHVAQMRQGLARMRDTPGAPRFVKDPISGELIDMLDGETDRLLDQMERVALHVLGLPVPKGKA